MNLSSLNPQQRLAVETVQGPVLILAGAGTGKTRVITFRIAYLIERGIPPANILAVTFTNKAAREMKERVTKLMPRSARTAPNEASSETQHDTRTRLRAPRYGAASHAPVAPESDEGGSRITPHAPLPARPTLCTFHSLCVRILRQHIEKLGYKRNFVIYDESEQLSAIKKILARIAMPPGGGEKTDPAAVLALLSRFKNGGERAAVFADEGLHAMVQHIRARYESALRACNAVDFDDLILLTLRLFNEHPEALAACRAKYRYVMVDEYQDTNAAQFLLVQALTQEHRNLCVVGDDDQSIYGWRGAEIANLLDMEKHFPEVKVIKLEQNYRSTNTILNAANAIIRHNARRRVKKLWSQKGDGPKIALHTFAHEEEEARSIVEQIEYARLAQQLPWASQAILFRTNLQSRPLETALRQARVRYRLIGGQSFFDRREVRDLLAYLKTFVNPDDDVSLLRIANVPPRGLSDPTMMSLLAASQERKCSVFAAMQNPVVAAAFQSRTRQSLERFIHFIQRARAALDPSDATLAVPAAAGEGQTHGEHVSSAPGAPDEITEHASLPMNLSKARVFSLSPRRRSGERVGERGYAKEAPPLPGPLLPSQGGEGDRHPEPKGSGAQSAQNFQGDLSLRAWAMRFLDEIGYFDDLRNSEKKAENAESRIRNLHELIATLDGQPEPDNAPSEPALHGTRNTEHVSLAARLQTFLDQIALDTEREAEDEGPADAVTLITMHSCKGLEFPHVYIVGMEDGLLPHSRSKDEGTLDEERRLFYVALTRAMNCLTISHCAGRKKYGAMTRCHPSPFLDELPPELVEHADEKAKTPVAPGSAENLFSAMRASVG